MASNKFVVSDLDFDTIKANLKSFLQDQPEFSDYGTPALRISSATYEISCPLESHVAIAYTGFIFATIFFLQ